MNINTRLLTAQIVGMFVVFGVALFGAAGTIAWVAGWVFLILFFGFVVAVTVWLARRNPELLKERATGDPGRAHALGRTPRLRSLHVTDTIPPHPPRLVTRLVNLARESYSYSAFRVQPTNEYEYE